MSEFNNVTVVREANIYFNGGVVSHSVLFGDGSKKTLGVMQPGEYEFSTAKKQKLLSGHWFRDRTVKRRHRKTHGKIAFTTLSKVISQGWRDLPEHKKAFYREVASEDLERYQRELDQYKKMDGRATVTGSSNCDPSFPPSGAFDSLNTGDPKSNRSLAE